MPEYFYLRAHTGHGDFGGDLVTLKRLIDDRDFLYGKLRGDFGAVFGDDHPLFQPHAPRERLAVLGY